MTRGWLGSTPGCPSRRRRCRRPRRPPSRRVALNRLLPRLGTAPVDRIDAQAVAALVAELHAEKLRKQTIRKTVSVLAMVLDHAGVQPNPARDRLTVKLPREEPHALARPADPTAGPPARARSLHLARAARDRDLEGDVVHPRRCRGRGDLPPRARLWRGGAAPLGTARRILGRRLGLRSGGGDRLARPTRALGLDVAPGGRCALGGFGGRRSGRRRHRRRAPA